MQTPLTDRLVALSELERLAAYRQVTDGKIPAKSKRPLLPHEVRSGVSFPAIARVLDTAYTGCVSLLEGFRTGLVESLGAALHGLTDPSAVGHEVTAWVTTPPAWVGSATVDTTTRLNTLLSEVAAAGGRQILAEAKAQGKRVPLVPAPSDRRFRMAAALPVQQVLAKVTGAVLGAGVRPKDTEGVLRAVRAVNLDGPFNLARQSVHVAHGAGRLAALRGLLAKPHPLTGKFAEGNGFPPEIAGAYSSEILDGRTCNNCESIDGQSFDSIEEAESVYPGFAGYIDCLGGASCRGLVVIIYSDEELPTPDIPLPVDSPTPATPPLPDAARPVLPTLPSIAGLLIPKVRDVSPPPVPPALPLPVVLLPAVGELDPTKDWKWSGTDWVPAVNGLRRRSPKPLPPGSDLPLPG